MVIFRLARKRMMNQQLANQISAATSAKQAQLRAIQQGMQNRNKNKPVSTVEPFQRQAAVAAAAAQAAAAVQAAVASTANDNGQVRMPRGPRSPRSRPSFFTPFKKENDFRMEEFQKIFFFTYLLDLTNLFL